MIVPGFVLLVMVMVSVCVEAITNNGGSNKSDDKLELVGDAERRQFTVYTDHEGKPFRFEDDSTKNKYEDFTNRHRNRAPAGLKGDKDALTSSSGHYDNGYGLYGPPDDQGNPLSIDNMAARYNYHGFQTPTYVSSTTFGNAHSETGLSYNHGHQTFGGHNFGHPPPHGHVAPHHAPDHNPLALKGLLLPLAGVALLGAAAALVSNPVLLQLGVITGRKRRRRSIKGDNTKEAVYQVSHEDIFANNKFKRMNERARSKRYNM